jgi:carbonic anhydrase/acetyltransferase-like protein (isoleucine patch superfamily)
LVKEYGIPFARLIHPAVDTLGVSFGGDDITVYENATLGAGSYMGEACIVFMNAVLGHGAHMDTCSILGPGAVLNARVQLGERSYFGTNASILQDLKIGIEATVGANSSVVGDVPDRATAMGVPAQIITMESTTPLPVSASAPTDPELEEKIKEIWVEILNVETIDSTVNFFDAGGTSLKAMQVFESLRQVTQAPLSLIDVFRFPTIESLINHLQANDNPQISQASKRAQLRRQRMRRSHA